MAYRLKIAPSQSLKLKGNAGFALPIIGGVGVGAAKSGGIWTVSLDFGKMPDVAIVNDDTAYILTWDSATELYTRINVTDLKTEFEGTFDGYYQPLDATLTALAALDSTAGLLVQTGEDTFARRTLTGTANEVTVTNGDGVSGDPTISLPSALTFTGKTVTGGTFSGAASFNKVDITAPTTGATLTIADGKTLTASNDATVSGTNTGDQTITLTGDVTGGGTGSFATTIAANAVTNEKLATAADGTIKSNISGSTATPSDNTITAVLDKLFGTTQGSVIYRGASSWAALTPGTSGNFLKTQGAAANPVWDSIPGGGDMLSTNNLSDVSSAATSRSNLSAFGSINKQVFTTSGTYTPSAGMLYAIIECVGGGGGGGGAQGVASQSYGAGGGGAGGYSRVIVTAADIGASKAVTIGAGGAGGSAGANNGTAGGSSGVGSLCGAVGGAGGGYGNSSQVPLGGLGGAAASGTGDLKASGAPGHQGAYVSGTGTVASGGAGGASHFGGGGRGGFSTTTGAGSAATSYGAGGGGAMVHNSTSTAAGGAGADGVVMITEFCS